ncbi:MAG: hypothetical protein ABJC09_09755 [Terriglobia bacterium]
MIRWGLLFIIAAIYGIAGALVFRRSTDTSRLRVSMDKMIAAALEMPLFFDEPAVVWRAQRALLVENVRMLRLIALPSIAMASAFLLLYAPMNQYLGRRPLAVGQSAVISAIHPHQLPGLAIETPPVHISRTGIVSWRVRALAEHSDPFPYHGERSAWLPWFGLVSMISAAGISLRR